MGLEPAGASVAGVAVLAGVLGLDVVSFPQAMISRPIVAATVAGALAGSPVAGLACGAALECLALETLPVGASRYPEWGSASAVAGAVAATGAGPMSLPHPGMFVVAVVAGIVAGWYGGESMSWHRRLIARFARRRLGRLAEGDRRTVYGLQAFGIGADLLRGALNGLLFFLPARATALWVSAHWSLPGDLTRAVTITAVAAVAAAALWIDFHAISGTRRLFLLSLTLGTLLVVIGV
ncbi:MAG: PTS sugar transporter subunit IIC [Gemmatimonadaceae bacterium]